MELYCKDCGSSDIVNDDLITFIKEIRLKLLNYHFSTSDSYNQGIIRSIISKINKEMEDGA